MRQKVLEEERRRLEEESARALSRARMELEHAILAETRRQMAELLREVEVRLPAMNNADVLTRLVDEIVRSWMQAGRVPGQSRSRKASPGPPQSTPSRTAAAGHGHWFPTVRGGWRSLSAVGRSSTTRSRRGSKTRGSSWNQRSSRSSSEKAMAGCDYANARVRAMKGRLLGRKGIMDLLAQPDSWLGLTT